ncbi:acyl-CoA thioesterase [Crenobacter caeni]|uniref:Acyl-CoA thioesterase n=1 Tax=Crenobacter caeni TaxID=2705474 RepID=A0A6B2KNP8_9NEIS|nr:thioesterase family protein [Crenobacter caeni]NDV11763.1 acyl-CoA thioesterase [Crenobacter caeni]
MQKTLPSLGEKQLPVRWGDLDAIGHLNNTVYFRLLEEVRVQWLEDIGLPIEPGAVGPVIVHTACHFKREINYPATVTVSIELEHLGRSSLRLRHHFYVGDDRETVYALGEVTLVWVDYAAGKSVPLPEEIRALCEAAAATCTG